MRKLNVLRRAAWGLTLAAGVAVAAVAAPKADTAPKVDGDYSITELKSAYEGQTQPSEQSKQNFDLPGVVEKMLVKEGDTVQKGQVIAEQSVTVDKAHLAVLKLLAASTYEIEAEKAALDKAKVDLTRKTELRQNNAISPSEYDQAALEVQIDQFKVKHAEEEHQKAILDVAEQEQKIEEKQLKAKVSGVVAEINTHEGELANSDTQHPTVTIVNNDPLWVEVDIPAEQSRMLKLHQKLQVHYKVDREMKEMAQAEIIFIRPVANPDSGTQHVRLQMPNPDKRDSGMQVVVHLPDGLPGVAAADSARANVNH